MGGRDPTEAENQRRIGGGLLGRERDGVIIYSSNPEGIERHLTGDDRSPVLYGPVVPLEVEPGCRVSPAFKGVLEIAGCKRMAVGED